MQPHSATRPAKSTGPAKAYRVVQWATGTIGARALRAVIEHPHITLAGVYVHADDKVNRDAGELCRLLSSGSNVVTTCGLFHHPSSMDPGARARAEAACEAGSASIHSTGSSPGFITEAVPLVMTSIQRRLDSLTIDEYADLSRRNSPELLFGLMGFGRAPGSFEEYRAAYLQSSFGPSLQLVASAVGLPLDSLKAGGELAARAASENDVLLFRNRGLAETERTIDTLALLMTEC
jgi:hypothetical protein